VGRIAAAFVRGAQGEGVAATAKHFPGHHRVDTDPFGDPSVRVPGSRADLEPGLAPYRAVITAGVKAVMTGPVPTDGMDPDQPSSTSPVAVRALREEFGFGGLIISDDIDLPGTMRGRNLAEVAIAGIAAGVEPLLLAAAQAETIATALAEAVRSGRIAPTRLARAADAVRRLARDVN
jgi:beta-N-acetylhexosaminidase